MFPNTPPFLNCIKQRELSAVKNYLTQHGFHILELDGSTITDAKTFFEIARKVFPSDPPFGPVLNLDAFDDSFFGGLDILKQPRVAVIWTHVDKVLLGGLRDLLVITESIHDVAMQVYSPKSGISVPVTLLLFLLGEGENFSEFVRKPFLEIKDPRLLRNVLNEVLNGLIIDDFDTAIGMEKAEVQKLLTELNELPDEAGLELDRKQTVAFRNALHRTLSELGVEEFQTRTGIDFADSQDVLTYLNDLALRTDLEQLKMTFGDIIRAICKYPKAYLMNGTFGEVLACLDGNANGRAVGNRGRSSSFFNPFADWLADKMGIERIGNFWQAFWDSCGDDETAIREFSRYWTEYEAAGCPGCDYDPIKGPHRRI